MCTMSSPSRATRVDDKNKIARLEHLWSMPTYSDEELLLTDSDSRGKCDLQLLLVFTMEIIFFIFLREIILF